MTQTNTWTWLVVNPRNSKIIAIYADDEKWSAIQHAIRIGGITRGGLTIGCGDVYCGSRD